MHEPLARFHPAVAAWFRAAFGEPTEAQRKGWPSIADRQHTLIAAPTGSGKTLAAFLSAIDTLVKRGIAGTLRDEAAVVYVSPLKALSHDIEKNLAAPLAGVAAELARTGHEAAAIRTLVRTGDTPAHVRAAAAKRPPHLVVTTPESLFILLTSESGRRMLHTVRTVIVDEIHALAGDKRGSHLALSLERLEHLVRADGGELCRVGLSATQRPIAEIARFLVGAGHTSDAGSPACTIIDAGHRRDLDLAIELPRSPLEAVMSHEVWEELHARLAELALAHRTTIVFVNTRRLAERLARQLGERLGEGAVAAHHGSMSKKQRQAAEARLKQGELRVMVATASLELGIDIGEVELVCQIAPTRTISALLQRVGRSGHRLFAVPKGRLFPLSRDELVECAALMLAVKRGELDRLEIPDQPLDILAQQLVAMAACETWDEDALFALVRRAWPYRRLTREAHDATTRMLTDGFATSRGRRGAHLHHDAVNGKLRGRRGARLAAITSGGAIPDLADYEVLLEPAGLRVGTLNEDFAIESMAGDVFQLGNVAYRILRVEPGKVRVASAAGEPPTVPFWLGEAPSRTDELSACVSIVRREIAARADRPDAAREWLVREAALGVDAARQLVDYLALAARALGVMPTTECFVLERFFDERGGMHIVLHAPIGSRKTRALGLALRKCFCRKFDFELQAAATEDAVLLSLGPTHSFALEEVWDYLKPESVLDVLTQALIDAPMFTTRWRWNATRALAVLRFRGGKRVLPRLLRMDADDLLALAFPDQAACLENIVGRREIPDHPLVTQTVDDCLTEAMDGAGLVATVSRIARRELDLFVRDVTEPSPLTAEILTARPYAFLDDAPLEERRAQAVLARRWLDPSAAVDLGALSPDAIAKVRSEAWPCPRDADELHDALVLYGVFAEHEGVGSGPSSHFEELVRDRRAAVATLPGGARVWVAAERVLELKALHPTVVLSPTLASPPRCVPPESREAALVALVRGRLDALGPTTAAELAHTLSVDEVEATAALVALETEGVVLRGRFEERGGDEWCEKRLLARIHRYTIDRLRREIEPSTVAEYLRFLVTWQHVGSGARLEGRAGLEHVVRQLGGFEAPAGAWESDVLPARIEAFEPHLLDELCMAGRVVWARLGCTIGSGRGPVRTTPIALMQRTEASLWLSLSAVDARASVTEGAARVLATLERRGASFFDDLLVETRLLRAELEGHLGELASAGLAASDGFAGLRALIAPSRTRGSSTQHGPPPRARRHGREPFTMASAGRWAALDRHHAPPSEASLELVARTLLSRWGVVFRRLLDREGELPPWRDLLPVLRRLEARGELRGGRFIDGFAGEQFALPEAVALLRKLRREPPSSDVVSVSAADPLNLVGILTPGPRVPAVATNRLLLRAGVPIACREGNVTRLLGEHEPGCGEPAMLAPELERALVSRKLPPRVRAYLGS